jgi:hypothetical protein
MALTPCRECAGQISDQAAFCPHCGAEVLPRFKDIPFRKKASSLIILVIIFWPAALLWTWIGACYVKSGDFAKKASVARRFAYTVAIGVFGAVLIAAALNEGALTTTALPGCGDSETIETLKSAVADSPLSKILNRKILEVKDPRELSWSPDLQRRRCTVTAYTNAGEQTVNFALKWIDQSNGKYWLEIEP